MGTFVNISRIHCSNSFFAGSLNIKTVSVVKDLGIYISDKLKWSYHISHIHRNACLCSHQILLSFSTKNIWILVKAFITYVRPKVEFNTCVSNPHLKKDLVVFESVQRNFTHYAFIRSNIPFHSYNDRLCNWQTWHQVSQISQTQVQPFFFFSYIFILLSRESNQCAIRARLRVAGHMSTTPRWGNPAKCFSQPHYK